jgi:hypothetical protein
MASIWEANSAEEEAPRMRRFGVLTSGNPIKVFTRYIPGIYQVYIPGIYYDGICVVYT